VTVDSPVSYVWAFALELLLGEIRRANTSTVATKPAIKSIKIPTYR